MGSHLAADLAAMGEKVLVADIQNSGHAHYAKVRSRKSTSPGPRASRAIALTPDDLVYNLSAKMLSPIVTCKERHDFFWPVNLSRHRKHPELDGEERRQQAGALHHVT